MIVFEGPRDISPFPSGLGVARPRSEPRLLCFLGVFCVLPCLLAALIPLVRTVKPAGGSIQHRGRAVAVARPVPPGLRDSRSAPPVLGVCVLGVPVLGFARIDPGSSHSAASGTNACCLSSDRCVRWSSADGV